MNARAEPIKEQEQGVMDMKDIFIYLWQEIHQKKKPRELHTASMMAHFSKEIDNSKKKLAKYSDLK